LFATTIYKILVEERMFNTSDYVSRVNSALTDEEKIAVFPWKRLEYSDDDIHKMMDNLKNFATGDRWRSRISKNGWKLLNVNVRDTTFNGKNFSLISLDTDYEDWNILSDMFLEDKRLKAKLRFRDTTAWEYFFNNISSLVDENCPIVTLSEVREKLFDAEYECTSFRPNIACVVYKMFNATKILDFSSGWGDRLIGAIGYKLSDPGRCVEYTGIDPNSNLQEGYASIKNFFGVDPEKFKTIVGKAQDISNIIPSDEKFDLVFTSPPYFDFEDYESPNGDKDDFSSEDRWIDDFLKPSIEQAWSKLIEGGHLVININQSSKKQTYVQKMLDFVGSFSDASYLGVIAYTNNRTTRNPQPIWIWRKTSSPRYTNAYLTLFEYSSLIYNRYAYLSVRKDAKPHPSIDPEKFNYDNMLIAKHEIDNKLVDYIVARVVNSKGKRHYQHSNKMILPNV
jgi:hypothetical protein